MSDPDVITWTAIISGYVRCGKMGDARRLFDRIDAKKNVVTWTAMVSGYMRNKCVFEAEELFERMPERNVVTWNTMIDGYVRNGRVDLAVGLFERMPERNVVSWNTVVNALVKCGRIEDAERVFSEMPEKDVISWTAMVGGLARFGRVDEARRLFDRMPERNVVSWNAMVTGYTQNKRLDEAFYLFERMPEKDVPSWNTMITGFIQNGELRRARKLFDEMPVKNVVSWSTLINGYVLDDQSEEALKFFMKMQAEGSVKPNEGTFVSLLGACSSLAGLSEGKQIHQIISKTLYHDDKLVISALLNMYSKCGELTTAKKIFDDGLRNQRDLISWNGMIAAYAHHGRGSDAINLFKEMQYFGFKPNDVTYVALLAACSHAGLVEEGLHYFDKLMSDRSIQVNEDHYTCLIDLYGRAGSLKGAFDLIKKLPVKPSSSVWGALLAGCNVYGNASLGNLVSKQIMATEAENAGTYILQANIYSSSGNYREAANIRMKMKDKGLKKQPGCSWIEIGNRFHVFVVGDKSHSDTKLIYNLLGDIHAKMKKNSYVQTDGLIMEEEFLVT
ncbi:Pentatricopeptide repeat-containing protein, mitochondrial [Heracleum sosnowskyi]|uniref:Pentatricopeptide repeat-containing protein, mitochondrial n=1 Tax=Heracleum sosnowskyi TaxID=360622 RepID=A0AAD8MQG0_9APIA|nr:Pentatricopeptide repeat-containing protein, mitochondrial [Heracleum sosnowskyi]